MKQSAGSARAKENAARAGFFITSLVSLAAVGCICVFIFRGAWPAISQIGLWNFLSGTAWKPNNDPQKFGIFYMIIGSLYVSGGALILGVPAGLGAAIFMAYFCPRRIYGLVNQCVKLLAGIPSIIYGLFGALFFGTALGMGYSIICGVLTISIMVLPTIIRTSEEAILSVNDMYREGSFALGAGKLRTIMHVVLPSAMKGIISSFILATGRIVGETAALLFTMGSVAQMPANLLSSSRTLAVHMYINTRDGGMTGRETAFASGVVLLILVVGINLFASWMERRAGKINEN